MSLNAILGTRFPLIQAPMAGVQDTGLSLAVSRSGGLGSLPAAMLDAQTLRRELQVLQSSGLPYNVNFFCHQPPQHSAAAESAWQAALLPYYQEFGIDPAAIPASAGRRPFDDEMADVLDAFSPTVVSFHFGLPRPDLLARVKLRGAFVLSSATTLNEARWLVANGADGVIAQGLEAGGHRGHFLDRDVIQQAYTFDLLKQLTPHIQVPIIAAGGIADAQGVQAAMAAGAAAVQVGTAFLLCHEAKTSALHRARLSDQQAPTALTNLFTGGLARGLCNRVMHELGPQSAAAPVFPMATQSIAPLRTKAEANQRDDFTPLWSGMNRSGCAACPAAEIVHQLAAGFTH
ncbi:nitronate monooxygenase [Limnohabitans sp.]|uniref:NAD(P)H-dependent flavin oxidoreductase n=1 Tax=Limnohabitans sp. TaxID=1907725 RepID=UPI00286EDB65|nr:nitronate monooxygenase [Limnohabitans sp.]